MAKFFIERPIFAIVVSILITLIGLIAGFALPIAQYPQISPPTIAVNATYMGANADVVNETVAQVIESEVNGVEGMDYMLSTSSDTGSYSLTVQFNPDVDSDIASVQTQNRVSQANATIPSSVQEMGITTEKTSQDMTLIFSLYSPNGTYDKKFLDNYANIYLVDELKRVPGVGGVQVFGGDYAMRVWLQPDKMAKLGVTIADVSAAIQEQNQQAPAGTLGKMPVDPTQEYQYTGKVKGRLSTPEEFENIIVRSSGEGAVIHLKDIASVELGTQEYGIELRQDGVSASGMGIKLTSDANALETVTEAKKVIEKAAKNFPPDLKYTIVVDNTDFIKESIREVVKTFVEALLLVLIIVFIFLQSWRATLIPMLAVPVSLIGTFGAFVVLGFSINTLTLFAMVLAIGLVVDDAIVVIEAVEHNMRYGGLSPKEATKKAMDEVSGPVVAIAFVLASVFIPVAFFGGTVGILYQQFALTIVVSMALSAIVALSLTPALCVLLLKPHDPDAKKGLLGRFFEAFNEWFERLIAGYGKNVGRLISISKICLIFLVVVFVLCFHLFKVLPSSFVPDEDQGYYLVAVNLPEGSSLNRTIATLDDVASMMKQQPGVKSTMAVSGMDLIGGGNKSNAGAVFATLEPWEERKTKETQIDSLIMQTLISGSQVPEGTVMAFNPPALPGLGMVGGFTMMLQNKDGTADSAKMAEIAQSFIAEASKRPEIQMAYTTYAANTPGYEFDVDREKVKELGVSLGDVFTALQTNLGGANINDFNLYGKTYKVMLQSDAAFRGDISMLSRFYLRNNEGAMVPLDTLLSPKPVNTAPVISRFNGSQAVQINGSNAPGYSTGQAMQALEDVASKVLPEGFSYEWSGQSREEASSSSSTVAVFGMAIIFVFLCLAALYESWSIPFVVLLSVPTGVLGALGSQYLRGLENNVYMQIGLVMLIGLAAKNAILIVEFAKAKAESGLSSRDAAIEGAKLRLRPIIMTSLAFIIGCIPLALASGAGAGSRVAMGTAVVGGMTVATLLGIFIIPVLFVVIHDLPEKFGRFKKAKKSETENL